MVTGTFKGGPLHGERWQLIETPDVLPVHREGDEPPAEYDLTRLAKTTATYTFKERSDA